MQTFEHSDGCEENMCQKTTDAMIKNQHDCLVVRVCQKTYVEAQQNAQFVSDGRRTGSFQTSFCNTSERSRDTAEKIFETLLNRFGSGVQGHQAKMRFEKRRQREDETIDKLLVDLEMLRRRSQPDDQTAG